jgi:type I restriction enzyme S subunit
VQQTLRSFGRQTTNISNLDIQRCLQLALPLPPLPEQKRIAAILDAADALRRKRQAADARLDALIQSVFIERFGDPRANPKGWPTARLGDVFARSPNFGTMRPAGAVGDWLCLRVVNIQDWKLDLSDQKYVELASHEEERHTVSDRDLLMARAIASQDLIGKCIVAYPAGRKWAFDSHLMRLRLDRNLAEPEYVKQALQSPGGRWIFSKNSRRSTIQFNVNTKEAAQIALPMPPAHVQRQFVRIVHEVEAQRARQGTQHQEIDSLQRVLQATLFATCPRPREATESSNLCLTLPF